MPDGSVLQIEGAATLKPQEATAVQSADPGNRQRSIENM